MSNDRGIWSLAALAVAGVFALAPAVRAQVPDDVAAQIAAIGRTVNSPATAKIYGPLQKVVPQPGVIVSRDVAYGDQSKEVMPKEVMDVFSKAGAGHEPILIFVHGGGYVGGDKTPLVDGKPGAFSDNMMLWAVDHGMVGINMNYALAPRATFPKVQQEIAEVVDWARRNAGRLGGDPDKIVIWGHSAGAGQVASFLAHPDVYAQVTGAKKPVAAVVLTSGDYEFASDKDHAYFGPAATLAARSATQGLIASATPLFVIHAELDPPAVASQTEALHAALTQAGRPHEYLVAARHGHMSQVYAVNTADQSVSGAVLAFIQQATDPKKRGPKAGRPNSPSR